MIARVDRPLEIFVIRIPGEVPPIKFATSYKEKVRKRRFSIISYINRNVILLE